MVKGACRHTGTARTCPQHSGDTPPCPHGPNPREAHFPQQPAPCCGIPLKVPGRGHHSPRGGWRGAQASHSATLSPPFAGLLPHQPVNSELGTRRLRQGPFRLSGTRSTMNWAWGVSDFGLLACAASGKVCHFSEPYLPHL